MQKTYMLLFAFTLATVANASNTTATRYAYNSSVTTNVTTTAADGTEATRYNISLWLEKIVIHLLATCASLGLVAGSVRTVVRTMNDMSTFRTLLVASQWFGTAAFTFVTGLFVYNSRQELDMNIAQNRLLWSGLLFSVTNLVFAPFFIYVPSPVRRKKITVLTGATAIQLVKATDPDDTKALPDPKNSTVPENLENKKTTPAAPITKKDSDNESEDEKQAMSMSKKEAKQREREEKQQRAEQEKEKRKEQMEQRKEEEKQGKNLNNAKTIPAPVSEPVPAPATEEDPVYRDAGDTEGDDRKKHREKEEKQQRAEQEKEKEEKKEQGKNLENEKTTPAAPITEKDSNNKDKKQAISKKQAEQRKEEEEEEEEEEEKEEEKQRTEQEMEEKQGKNLDNEKTTPAPVPAPVSKPVPAPATEEDPVYGDVGDTEGDEKKKGDEQNQYCQELSLQCCKDLHNR
jgi:hypothetical protein